MRGILYTNNKAFTLIELLTIIVILAIIAVITVPIILNIIENARRGAAIDSAYGYRDSIEQYYLTESIGGTTSDVLATKVVKDTATLEENGLTVSGDEPTQGWVQIDKGQVIDYSLKFGEYVVNYDDTTKSPVAIKGGTVDDEPAPDPVSFAEDDWSTIIANVKAGNISKYNVGDTKAITLTSDDTDVAGTYTLRIANTSTPNECKTTGFSQTACGFVLEFADIITEHSMNSTNTNVGGWGNDSSNPATSSAMRTYVNSTIYNAIPELLKSAIINTTVVSGHGPIDSSNFITTDKLYLLSEREVLNYTGDYDTAQAQTRQLDYYEIKSVTTSSHINAIKKEVGGSSGDWWWLRSVISQSFGPFSNDNNFTNIIAYGGSYYCNASVTGGVSPAFRIAE